MASRARSGGGINSNKLVQPSVRTGPPRSNIVNPGGADQLGQHMTKESSATPLFGGQVSKVPMGNTVAGNVGAGGPGAGRTVMRSGSQGRHGPVAQGSGAQAPDVPGTKPGADILSGFGKERS